jgi:hypothetical protein
LNILDKINVFCFHFSVIHIASSEVKRTSSVETYLHGLLKYTNYSVRLLAYTSVGDGVVSDPAYCSTEQDGKCNIYKNVPFLAMLDLVICCRQSLLLLNSKFYYNIHKAALSDILLSCLKPIQDSF